MEWTNLLELGLRIAAAVQLGVAVLNLFLIRIMNWEPDLARAPLLIREVFRIPRPLHLDHTRDLRRSDVGLRR